MPELPDLQVFSHNLSKELKGKTLSDIELLVDRKLKVPASEIKSAFEGQKLTNIKRVGKELHFEFGNGHVLGLHLMLHGELHYYQNKNENRFTIAELKFDGGKGLAITDFQKAATLTLDPETSNIPDALDSIKDYLKEKLAKNKKAVKTVLMDQKVIRGIGNAYADEILYAAGISPLSISNKIPGNKVDKLIQEIKLVLENADKEIIKAKPDLITGEYRDFVNVHQPKKKETPKGELIKKTEIDGRKTYFTDSQQIYD